MDWTKPSQVTSLLGVLLSTTAATVTPADAQSFGKVGAVNQEATGTPPGGATRKLTVGAGIVVKERVRTSASGSTQIQFPDQSAINLGANCDMVIDQFVYDPQSKSGTMAATVTRGALRYIGGQISHNSGATIRTPSANLGIRGGMVTVVVQLPAGIAQKLQQLGVPPGGTLVLSNFGQITVSNNVGSVNLLPGFATVLGGPNDPIPTPFRLPDDLLQLITQLINSKPGQTGGVANIPTQGNVPEGYKFTIVTDPTAPPGTDPLGYISIFGAGNSAGKGVSQTTQGGSVTTPPPPPPPSYGN
jgi:FecR-like protein